MVGEPLFFSGAFCDDCEFDSVFGFENVCVDLVVILIGVV